VTHRKKRWLIALVLVAAISLLFNAKWLLFDNRMMPLYPICKIEGDSDTVAFLEGRPSKKFNDAMLGPPRYRIVVTRRDGDRYLSVNRYLFVDFLGFWTERNWLHIKFSSDLADMAQKKSIGKVSYTEQEGPNHQQACSRIAKWVIEPVGKDKQLKCSGKWCRVLGVKEEPEKK